MKKLLVIFTVLVVLFTMFISVSADSNLITINSGPSDMIINRSSSGEFTVVNTINVTGPVESYVWQLRYPDGSWFTITNRNGNSHILKSTVTNSTVDNVYIRCRCYDFDGAYVTSRVALIELEPTNLFNIITSSLRYATSWVGSVVSSLTNGALSGLLPVLAIGVAIAALLIVIKITKLFGWGA